MNKYFSYVRKSSESEDRQVASIPDQLKELDLLRNRLKLPKTVDFAESRSAKIPGRSEFNKMIEEIEHGGVEGILCWNLSRLARNGKDGGAIIWAVNELGLDIITPSKTFTKEDIFLMYVEFGMANKFINDLSKDTKWGLKSKAERGWLPSGAKAGYMNDKFAEKGNKTVLSDPERFTLIRKAWEAMLTGTYSVMQILRLLNEEWGYRTPKHKRIGGKPMTRSQIYKTLTDPFYYGEFEYPRKSGTWYKGTHEPMITRQEFERVQMLLGRKGRPRPRTLTFDYTGLMSCGECEAAITAEEKFQIICASCKHKFASQNKSSCPQCKVLIEEMNNPTLLHYVYYHCTKRKNPNCMQGSIRLEVLNKQFDDLLSRIQISERFKDWAIKYLNELNDKEVKDRSAVQNSVQGAYNDCVHKIDNLVKLKISPQNSDGSLFSNEEFKSQKEALMAEKEHLKERLGDTDDRVNKWVELSEKTFNFACHARYLFANGDTQAKREILVGLGSNLTLKDKIVRINLEKPLGFIEEVKNEIPEVSQMFEPEEKVDSTIQLETLWSQNPTMLPLWDIIRIISD